jgi:protein phosphatase
MGGQQAGDVASRVVVTVLPALIERLMAGANEMRGQESQTVVRETVLDLGRRLRSQSAGQPGLKGMGATVALVWLASPEGLAQFVHMGDNRIYLLRRDALRRLPEDHSIALLLLEYGEITLKKASRHLARGRLSRYLGSEAEAFPDVQEL